MIKRAASPLPQPYSDRYREEWLRELQELPDGPVTRLIWVLPLVIRRASLARELGVSPAVVGLTGTLKRLTDIVVAACALVIIAPLLLVIGACIKLQDGGPVIVRQMRIGLNGKPFRMWKFRTTFVDAETDSLVWVRSCPISLRRSDSDPRLTPLGKFLRRYSLELLPQIINILSGSMSVVGPRPRNALQFYLVMEAVPVRPGLTGLWQIEAKPDEDQRRLDREYVKHWSLWLDAKILFKTFVAVLGRP
jgi:lipopolysaccharide/colanic/teichoic acid biosynthesis glycosyltransferase